MDLFSEMTISDNFYSTDVALSWPCDSAWEPSRMDAVDTKSLIYSLVVYRVISRNFKLGGYRLMLGGGVNTREAQIYIKKH